MFKTLTFIFLALLISYNAGCQTVSGIIKDVTTAANVANATVKLSNADSTIQPLFSVSNSNGEFVFKNVPSGSYTLTVTSIGYSAFNKQVSVIGQNVNTGTINISKSAETLSTVVINNTPPVKQNGDTLDYAASQYKVNPDATSEDLIRKMPGVTVDKTTGAVTAQGETVQKVTVDGRDFFGDDATATLRNLPAEVVDKIQVFDKLSDQAQLTGFDDGNTTKSINIVTKKDMRTGNFGRIFAGYGTDDRYSAGGNVSFFNNARRISLIGLVNTVNQQKITSQDLLGVTSSGNRGGGGRRGGGGGGNFRGGSSNFMVGPQSGIAKTNAFGVNYSDAWGKKIDVTGSYFFNNSNTNNNQSINQQNFITADSSQYYDENTISNNENYNNRVNLRLTYRIDSNNTIIATSNLNFQKNNAKSLVNGTIYLDPEKQNILSKTENDINSNNNGSSNSNMILFRHAFAKKGRSISLGIYESYNNKNGQNFLNAYNSYYKSTIVQDTVKQLSDQSNFTNQYRFNLEYTETVAPKTQLQISYNPSFQSSKADQETSNFDDGTNKYSELDTSLSNKFDNTYNTQNAGITIRHGDRNNMISAGISYQYSELKSSQVFPQVSFIDNSYSNFLANAFSRFKLSNRSTLRIIYRGSVSPPSVTQLQNVINTTNQLFYTTGNPNLQQQYTNNLITRYTYTNTAKSESFFANLFFQNINNYVTNATYTASRDSALTRTVTLFKGSQLSKPVNMNGYINARSFFTFGLPVKFIKSNLNLNAGLSYAKQPGMINNVENISNSFNYNLGAVLSSNISEYVDFDLSYSANINTVKNTIQPNLNNNYFTQSAGIDVNLLTKKGTFLQNSVSNQSYKGLTDGFNQNYWLWNMAVGQKFLKNQDGELKLSVFDLLNQNKSITRTVTESYVQDQINEVLRQYFMLTFTYKLKTFGKGKPVNNDEKRRNFGGFGGGFGGPPPGSGRPGGPQL
jgi:hypothetical protein